MSGGTDATTTAWFTLGGSALTGLITYLVTSRGIRASDHRSVEQLEHDAKQREEDRLNQLRAVQLAAHDTARRRAYVVIMRSLRYMEVRQIWMRTTVLTGTEEDFAKGPEDPETAYAEIDLVISNYSRDLYLKYREAGKELERAYKSYKDVSEQTSYGPGPISLEDARDRFHKADVAVSERAAALKEQMREDLNPAAIV